MSTDYKSSARTYASAAGLDPNIFVAQIQAESGFNPRATSPAGAQGIAQFLPSTAASLGINPWDPQSALQGAAKLDSNNLHKYGGDYDKMLAAYNAGGGAVDAAINRYGANWLSHMPSETQQYIKKIMSQKSSTSTTPSPSPSPSSSSSNSMLDQIKLWGEYIAIFAIAIIVIVIGFLLLGGGDVIKVAKKAVRV